MNWTEAELTIPKKSTEEISNFLIALGIKNFAVEDYDDFEEMVNDSGLFYDYIDDELFKAKGNDPIIRVYFPENTQGRDMLEALKGELELLKREKRFESLKLTLKGVKEEDWENNWKQYFKTFTVGDKLVVKPSWETCSPEMAKGREIIEIDPASSFGTGTHATTRLCLSALEHYIIKSDSLKMLDMGCGSGILSIGGLLLGAGDVTAIDIDENAARIAAENLDNNSGERFTKDMYRVYCGNILDDEQLTEKIGSGYQIIAANIVAGIIILMAPIFRKLLCVGGILIASGIIGPRADEVEVSLINEGFTLIKRSEDEDWVALEMRN